MELNKVTWLISAHLDLDNILEHISIDSRKNAIEFKIKTIKETRKLKEYSKLGRKIPEINKENFREIIYKKYRIMYEISNKNIYIMFVVHSSMKF